MAIGGNWRHANHIPRVDVRFPISMDVAVAEAQDAAISESALTRIWKELIAEAEGGDIPAINDKKWFALASTLSDMVSELSLEAVQASYWASRGEGEIINEAHMEAVRTCEDLLEITKSAVPDLYSVASHSKRSNKKLAINRRSAVRCLTELGLLIGTYAALRPGDERESFLGAVRMVAQTADSAERVPKLLLMCRGFYTPGAGKNGRSWRKIGRGTVHQIALLDDGHRKAQADLSTWLTNAPDHVAQYSRKLRAAFPFLNIPLQLWLHRLTEEQKAELVEAMSAGMLEPLPIESAAVALIRLLVERSGAEGTKFVQTVASQVVDAMLACFDQGSVDPALEQDLLELEHKESILLGMTNNGLVRGKSKMQSRWLGLVERIGHAVWLMFLAAKQIPGSDALMPATGANEDVEQRVKQVMLTYFSLERMQMFSRQFSKGMKDPQIEPSKLWSLFAEAVYHELEPPEQPEFLNSMYEQLASMEEGAEEDTGSMDELQSPKQAEPQVQEQASASVYGSLDNSTHGAPMRFLRWFSPDLVFKFIDIIKADEDVWPAACQWARALLELDGENVHQLRFDAPPNAFHFAALASVDDSAERVVDLWTAADKAGSIPGQANPPAFQPESEESPAALPGECDPEALFMLGEEIKSCIRIDKSCVKTTRALLGYLAQGHVRILRITDAEEAAAAAGDTIDVKASSARSRTAIRSCAWLLGRGDTGQPVIFVDKPMFGPHLASGDTAADDARMSRLSTLLLEKAEQLGRMLDVPVAPWTVCRDLPGDVPEVPVALAPVARANIEDSEATGSSEANKFPESEGVPLVEFDGLAPIVYNNLRTRALIRCGPEARGLPVETGDYDEESRYIVHALAHKSCFEEESE